MGTSLLYSWQTFLILLMYTADISCDTLYNVNAIYRYYFLFITVLILVHDMIFSNTLKMYAHFLSIVYIYKYVTCIWWFQMIESFCIKNKSNSIFLYKTENKYIKSSKQTMFPTWSLQKLTSFCTVKCD